MNNKQRDILHVHKNFLLSNIIWTSELCKKLQSEGLVTESVIRSIENANTQAEKVSKILEFVIMRGPEGYKKFADILHVTGHTFIADFLREEDIIKEKLNTEDMYKALPFLTRLKDNEKNELDTYFIDKFRNESLRLVWKHDFREKEKAIQARYNQIEMADEIKGQTKKWQEVKRGLEEHIAAQKEEIEVLNLQIKSLHQAVRETETRLRSDFQKQVNFNAANENQIKRVQERVVAAEFILRDINGKMSSYLKKKSRILTEKERKELESYEFSFMIPDFEVLMDQYRELLKIKKLYDALREEKEYVITYIIGYTPNNLDDLSLKDEFKKYLFKHDEQITQLKDKLSESEIIIEGQKEQVEKMIQDTQSEKTKFNMGTNVWQAAIMNVMRNQLQDVKRDIRKKESRIQFFENETARLRNTISEMKQEAERAKQDKQSTTSRETRHTISIDMNGRLSMNSEDSSVRIRTVLDDYNDSKTEHSKLKESLLPPMSQKVIQAAASPTSPRKISKPKPIAVTSSKADAGRYQSAIMQHGLITAPVRLEARHQDKYSQMPYGFGDLKQMHSQGKSKFEKSLITPKIKN